jgi:hypothetical protein
MAYLAYHGLTANCLNGKERTMGSIPVAGFTLSNQLIFVIGVISSSNDLDTKEGMKGLSPQKQQHSFSTAKDALNSLISFCFVETMYGKT